MAGGHFGGGYGTSASPYLVEDADDLNAVRNNIEAHYQQTADIDLAEYENWEPLWDAEEYVAFTGSYDGNGFTIANLTVDKDSWDVGLFGMSENVTFKGIVLKDVDVKGRGNVGALSGYMGDCTVKECYVLGGIIEGNNYNVGGMAGNVVYDSVVEDCGVDVTVGGVNEVGGMFGQFRGNMKRCWSKGSVSGEHTLIGGLIGNYFATADKLLEECFSEADVVGEWGVGGMFGGLYSFGVIKNCYSRGDVELTGGQWSDYIGGFAGDTDSGRYGEDAFDWVIHCYSTATIDDQGASNVGGLLGSVVPTAMGDVVNSYYDSTLSGQSDSTRGTPRTTAAMTHPTSGNTYVGWDFDSVWMHDRSHRLNDGYVMFHRPHGIVEGEGHLSSVLKFIAVLLAGAVHASSQLRADLVSFIEKAVLISGTINASTYLAIMRKLLMWAKRDGVYEPVKAYARHGGAYLQVTHVYKREDGTYRE